MTFHRYRESQMISNNNNDSI